jgi:hypothetical protein
MSDRILIAETGQTLNKMRLLARDAGRIRLG